MTILIETDGRSRVVLRGHANQRFFMRENGDGSILLIPAVVLVAAQYEVGNDSTLKELYDRLDLPS